MQIVTVKFQENVLQVMDSAIERHNFNSRTEFIREAVRDKLAGLTKEELVAEFLKYKGKAKTKLTDEQFKQIRAQAGKDLLFELDNRFK